MKFAGIRQRSKWGTTTNTRELIYRENPRKGVLGISHSHSNKEVTRIRESKDSGPRNESVQDISQYK